tara:strand:+ start:278 stop:733 length:456 start_codon:yes stop_codon:yes gene_type:complete
MDIVSSKNLIVVILLVNWVGGQVIPSQGVQKKIKFPEYDRKSGKITSLLTGDKAVPCSNGLILVEGARVETYKYDGIKRNVDLIIEAPACFFDLRSRIASSAGAMKAYRSDGQAMLEGQGFTWRHNPGSLVISNNVRTLMNQGFSINGKQD